MHSGEKGEGMTQKELARRNQNYLDYVNSFSPPTKHFATCGRAFLVVRSYYMDITSDAEARLVAYAMDSLARTYLGEYYATLYDLLASYI